MNQVRQRQTSRIFDALALGVIVVTILFCAIQSKDRFFINCNAECGETFLSHLAVQKFRSDGFRFALLENLGTSDNPSLYTHNVNLGALFFVTLESLGLTSVDSKQLVALSVFALGLLYLYLSVRLASGDPLLGCVVLVLLCTGYFAVLGFATNPLRAWHYVALFGTAFHLQSFLMASSLSGRAGNLAGLVFAALIAFGCGYDFWLICVATAASMLLLIDRRGTDWSTRFKLLALTGVVFAAPFAVRQLQVIAGMGFDYWLQDLLYSLAIKIPNASRLIDLPSTEDIDAFYARHHAFRPPALPSNSILVILGTWGDLIEWITIPRWGITTVAIFVFMAFYALVLRFGTVELNSRPPAPVAALLTDLLLPVTVGALIALAVFAPFSLHVYFKHEFPLVAALLMIAAGAALYWLIDILFFTGTTAPRRALALALLGLIIVDGVLVKRRGYEATERPNLGWWRFVTERPQARFLVSAYYPMGLAAVIGRPEDTLVKLDAAQVLKNVPPSGPDASRFDYWIYQPWDYLTNFDSPEPSCEWRDWLVGQLPAGRSPILLAATPWSAPSVLGPKSIFTGAAVLRNVPHGAKLVWAPRGDISDPSKAPPPDTPPDPALIEQLLVDTSYNCLYGRAFGWIRTGTPGSDTLAVVDLNVSYPSGDQKPLARITAKVDVSMPEASKPLIPLPVRVPKISQIRTAIPGLRVVETSAGPGTGYVIFDLRPAATRSSGRTGFPDRAAPRRDSAAPSDAPGKPGGANGRR